MLIFAEIFINIVNAKFQHLYPKFDHFPQQQNFSGDGLFFNHFSKTVTFILWLPVCMSRNPLGTL